MKDYTVRTDDQLTLLLQGFRKARGLTQAELAAQMGITQQTLSSAERNAARLSTGRLTRLLSALGVELVLRDTRSTTMQTAPDTPSSSSPEW